jgi:hypothetical protein
MSKIKNSIIEWEQLSEEDLYEYDAWVFEQHQAALEWKMEQDALNEEYM